MNFPIQQKTKMYIYPSQGKEGWLKKRHGDDNLWKLAK